MVEAVLKLREFWSKQDIKLRPGLSPGAIDGFESRFSVSLPKDLREYFLFADGFDGEMDDECLSFFSMEEAIKDSPIWVPPITGTTFLFAFADYLLSSHAYMIELQAAADEFGSVYVVYGPEWVRKVATTFSDFVNSYIAHDYAVLFPN